MQKWEADASKMDTATAPTNTSSTTTSIPATVSKPDFSAAADELKDAAGTVVGQFGLGGAGIAAEGDVSVPKPDFSAAADELQDAAAPVLGQFGLGGAGVAAEGDVSVPKPDFSAPADELKDAAGTGIGDVGDAAGQAEVLDAAASAAVPAKVRFLPLFRDGLDSSCMHVFSYVAQMFMHPLCCRSHQRASLAG